MALTEQLKKELTERFNGCPFMEDREKGSLDDLTGLPMTIEDIFKMADYHAIIFKEVPDKFYLTGGALKNLCNDYDKDVVIGLKIELQEKVKTSKKQDFRPMKVIFD